MKSAQNPAQPSQLDGQQFDWSSPQYGNLGKIMSMLSQNGNPAGTFVSNAIGHGLQRGAETWQRPPLNAIEQSPMGQRLISPFFSRFRPPGDTNQ